MKPTRELLENHADDCETQLVRLKAFVHELEEMSARHGTDESQLEDLTEARHNISYYEAELERARAEMGGGGGGGFESVPRRPTQDSILPRTPKQGAGALILASIGVIAGLIIGHQLTSRGGGGSDGK